MMLPDYRANALVDMVYHSMWNHTIELIEVRIRWFQRILRDKNQIKRSGKTHQHSQHKKSNSADRGSLDTFTRIYQIKEDCKSIWTQRELNAKK
jgi:hypothetical protein